MDVRDGFTGTVGHTPMIRLGGLSAATGCEIYGKAEFLNPGGSVKDRAALYIIRDAEHRGTLRPGGTVVEGTAGNTGIGLAHICAARGYRCIVVIPDTQSPEKMERLRMLAPRCGPFRQSRTRIPATTRRLPAGSPMKPKTPSGPTSSTTWPTARPITKRPGRKSGMTPPAASTPLSARPAPAARWRVSRVS